MIKFLLIIFLIFYLIYKVMGMLLGNFLQKGRSQQASSAQQRHQHYRPTDGNVTVDYVPNKQEKKSSKDFKGGEYVDYEVVKD